LNERTTACSTDDAPPPGPPETLAADLLRGDATGPRIPLLLHANLLADRSRTAAFAAAVRRRARPGVRLLELGSGTGLLSRLAAEAGADVTAVEAQRALHRMTERLLAGFPNARARRDDARRLAPEGRFDVIVCEMLDTWLVREPQLQVMRKALDWISPGGIVIPRAARHTVEPVEADFRVEGIDLPLPCHETRDVGRRGEPLGPAALAFASDFLAPHVPERELSGELQITRAGRFNALRLRTETEVDEGILHAGSDWLCPPLLIPVAPRAVAPGDRVSWSASFVCGLGFRMFRCGAR